jgi:hypothetical protein
VSFLENISENPSYQSQQELFDFLEHKNLPITDDGCFLAYKSVTPDYKDWHTKTIDNSIGAVIPRKKRSEVDDNRDEGCSRGYHAGSIEYVRQYYGGKIGHLMTVKINPVDVVSVPKECSCQKIRVTFYEVIAELDKDEVLKEPVYNSNLEPIKERESYDANFNPNWTAIDERYEKEDCDLYDEYDEEYEEEYEEEYHEDEDNYDDESDDFYLNPI